MRKNESSSGSQYTIPDPIHMKSYVPPTNLPFPSLQVHKLDIDVSSSHDSSVSNSETDKDELKNDMLKMVM